MTDNKEKILISSISSSYKSIHSFAARSFPVWYNNTMGTKKFYREFSPYANFITANFITAVFQKKSINLPYANVCLMLCFISAKFWLFLPNFANANSG